MCVLKAYINLILKKKKKSVIFFFSVFSPKTKVYSTFKHMDDGIMEKAKLLVHYFRERTVKRESTKCYSENSVHHG